MTIIAIEENQDLLHHHHHEYGDEENKHIPTDIGT